MKVLLDENLPVDLRHFIAGHEPVTVAFLGWKGVENGELLARAAAAGFNVLLTKDSAIEHEHSASELPLAVIVIKAKSNHLDDIRPLVPAVLDALSTLKPKTLVRVGPTAS